MPHSVLIDGIRYIPDPRPDLPRKLSLWYMHDNHTFTPVFGTSVDELCRKALLLEQQSPYGMFGRLRLLRGDLVEREIGDYVHSGGSAVPLRFSHELEGWRKMVEYDTEALHLIAQGAFRK